MGSWARGGVSGPGCWGQPLKGLRGLIVFFKQAAGAWEPYLKETYLKEIQASIGPARLADDLLLMLKL